LIQQQLKENRTTGALRHDNSLRHTFKQIACVSRSENNKNA
jgi:hypothetical protein